VVDFAGKGPTGGLLRRRTHSEAHQLTWESLGGGKIDDVSGGTIGAALGAEYARWVGVMRREGVEELVMVLELYRLRAMVSSDLEVLLPLTVNAGMMAWLGGRPREGETWMFVSPTDGKRTMTRERLERAGMWEVGEQHARDAWRYLAVAARRYRAGL